jgi:hypothetical protein
VKRAKISESKNDLRRHLAYAGRGDTVRVFARREALRLLPAQA